MDESDGLHAFPDARLAILPGTTHRSTVFDHADPWLAMVEAFLAAPMPA